MNYLFPDFPADYEKAVAWWQLLWTKIRQEGWETPFYNTSCQDGNPIFSAVNPVENRAVRVIQVADEPRDEDEDDSSQLEFWWDVFDNRVRELVVWVVLTEDTAVSVEKAIAAWVGGDLVFGSQCP